MDYNQSDLACTFFFFFFQARLNTQKQNLENQLCEAMMIFSNSFPMELITTGNWILSWARKIYRHRHVSLA